MKNKRFNVIFMSEKRKMRKVCILLLKQTRVTVAKRRDVNVEVNRAISTAHVF